MIFLLKPPFSSGIFQQAIFDYQRVFLRILVRILVSINVDVHSQVKLYTRIKNIFHIPLQLVHMGYDHADEWMHWQ